MGVRWKRWVEQRAGEDATIPHLEGAEQSWRSVLPCWTGVWLCAIPSGCMPRCQQVRF